MRQIERRRYALKKKIIPVSKRYSEKLKSARKQTEQEQTRKLTVFVYGFFILEACTLGGLFLGNSVSQDYGSSLGFALQLFFWSAIFSFASIVIGIFTLVARPRLFYMHIPLLFNCLIFIYILGVII